MKNIQSLLSTNLSLWDQIKLFWNWELIVPKTLESFESLFETLKYEITLLPMVYI